MSRIGAQPIPIPEKVTVTLEADSLKVAGPLGQLSQAIPPRIKVKKEDQQLLVQRTGDSKKTKSLHGLIRSLIANLILGVTQGWQKTLEIQGTGYRVEKQGEKLVFSLGFSHPVEFAPVDGIKFEVQDNRLITVTGVDKILVGNIAAQIRKIRPPDSYKGKGIRYQGEYVKLKPGKAGKAGAAGGLAASGS